MKFVFYLTCFLWGILAPADGDRGFKSVPVGDTLTLQCPYDSDDRHVYWYKQKLGQMPQLLSSTYRYNPANLFNHFKNDSRLSVGNRGGVNFLNLSQVRPSDSATYLCARGLSYVVDFVKSVTVSVQGSGSDVQAVVHQSGGSGTLSCTVHTGTCDGEHRVYWFKNSEDSQPGLVYTHGKDQCERKPDTHTCTYDLPPSASHSGSYHCAVASCGHIVFGNGTEVEAYGGCRRTVLVLSAALAFAVLLSVTAVTAACVRSKRGSPTDPDASSSGSKVKNGADSCFMALRDPKVNEWRVRDGVWTECVYFHVKH